MASSSAKNFGGGARRLRRAGLAALWLAVVGGPGGVASAQQGGVPSNGGFAAPAVESGQTESSAAMEQADARWVRLSARGLARAALLDLRLAGSQEYRELTIASELLRIAVDADPTDGELLRLAIEAAVNAGRSDLERALTARLVRLDPADTVAQLRLVSGRIADLQTVDERLAAYERFLGPEGRSLDASVRSRLALDAALLLRERGDTDGFTRRLLEAMRLDGTNKDAATLALTVFGENPEDPTSRTELIVNVLNADPLDPEVHFALARELARGGAAAAADRFYTHAASLRQVRGEEISRDEQTELLVSRWSRLGSVKFTDELGRDVDRARRAAADALLEAQAAGKPIDELRKPEDARLPLALERVRLLAAAASGNGELLTYALSEANETYRRFIEDVMKVEARPEGVTEEDAQRLAREHVEELSQLQLWCGRNVEAAAMNVVQLKALGATEPGQLALLQALVKMRGVAAPVIGEDGTPAPQAPLDDAARAALFQEGCAELAVLATDDPLAELGLALADEQLNDRPGAVARYGRLSEALSGTLIAGFARARVEALTGKPPSVTGGPSRTAALDKVASDVPVWLDAMIGDPSRFVELTAEVAEQTLGLLDDVRIKVRMGNVSRMNLGVGPERPLNSRFLLAPSLSVGAESIPSAALPQVASLARRLRLSPNQVVEAELWAESPSAGVWLQQVVARSIRASWRVLQGFQLNAEDLYTGGPLCLEATAGRTARPISVHAATPTPALLQLVAGGTRTDAAEALLVLRWRAGEDPGRGGLNEEEQRYVGEVAAQRFRALDKAGKLFFLVLAPTQAHAPFMAPLDTAALEDPDDDVAAAAIALRTADAAAASLDPAGWSARPAVAAIVTPVRERLAEGLLCHATWPGARGMNTANPGLALPGSMPGSRATTADATDGGDSPGGSTGAAGSPK